MLIEQMLKGQRAKARRHMPDSASVRSGKRFRLLLGLLMASFLLASACGASPSPDIPTPSTTSLPIERSSIEQRQTRFPLPQPLVRFEHLSVEDGLAHSEVWAIAQDSMGFLWFGTHNGLSKYDGHTFMTYRRDPDDEDSLRDSYVLSLYVDSGGRLWVGTFEGVLERFDRAEDAFTHYHIAERIYDITEDTAGNLWLGTASPGLLRFAPSTGEAETVWSASNVRGVDVDGEGNIWAASSESGIVRIDPTSLGREEYRPDYMVWDLASGPDGCIWLATIAAGVGVLDPKYGEIRYNMVNPEVLQFEGNNAIRKIYFDSEGLLWIGHYQTSLLRYDPAEDTFTHFIPDLTDPSSVMANSVLSLYRDQAGILWVGYGIGGGISKLVVGAERFGHYRHIPGDPNSLNTDLVIAIAGQGDTLWFGTFSGLDRWNRATSEWKNYQPNPTIPFSLVYSTVRSVYVDSQDTLWAGTEQGLERYDPTIDGFAHLGGPVVMWMHEGPSGRFWLATTDGLYEYDRDLERFNFIQRGRAAKIMVHEDSRGLVWVGTEGDGLERYDPSTDSWTTFAHDPDDPNSLSHNTVESILEDSSGAIWAATGGGLNRLDGESGTFTRFTVVDGLANDRIAGLLEDKFGDLWLATDSGLSRLHPNTGAIENYTTQDGVQGPNFWRNSYYKSEEGELFFGGANGINAFFPENIIPNPLVPPVVITLVSLFNQPLRADLLPGEQLTFDHDENFLSFDFAALDFSDPAQNQYAYKMEGVDDDWVQAGTRRHADYPNLRPGDYLFHVKGSNNDGVWNEEGASVDITIQPPFWEMWWFRGILLLALAGVAFSAYRLRVRSIEARSRELERQVEQEIDQRMRIEEALRQSEMERTVFEAVTAERSRLARELHDAVTQTLFSASLIAEVLPRLWAKDPGRGQQQLEEVRLLTRGALAEMRSLLLELRPEALAQAKMDDLLRQLGRAMTGRTGVPVSVHADVPCPLPADVQIAIYRIAQEALSNAAKHAEPSQVEVQFRCDVDRAALSIRDDGQGFDVDNIPPGHLGVGIMRERAAAVGAKLAIESEPGSGTEVRAIWEQGALND